MVEEASIRRRSKVVIYLHFVWAVKQHVDNIPPELERPVHRIISSEVEHLKGKVVAIGGMSDHIHLLVQMPGSTNPSLLIKQVKGVTSAFINDNRREFTEHFRWQDGYGCFSIGTDEESLTRVTSYIHHQKEHHTNNTLISQWEQTGEEIEISSSLRPEDARPKAI
ncbi:MAG: IS200/IS605 family transposase [Armatimonas sp.]